MRAPAARNELRKLLGVALRLILGDHDSRAEKLMIGETRYRLIAEQHRSVGWIVVLMQEPAEQFVSDDVLRRFYGLTGREVQVARLLIDRQSNKEIAGKLNITAYTAGRHTERVLKKLGLASRREVRAKLLV